MSHRKKWYNLFGIKSIIPIIVASIGLGMVLAILLPLWLWVLGAGIGLIAFAVISYMDK